jgi:SAM-dependent methyltransferase
MERPKQLSVACDGEPLAPLIVVIMAQPPPEPEAFDAFAEEYDRALDRGLSLTGEGKEYFAQGRLRWLNKRLQTLGVEPHSALDFGCGTGTATPFFFSELGIERLVGTDPSQKSLSVAERIYGSRHGVSFTPVGEEPEAEIDVAYCNGVFHHIVPEQRKEAIERVYRSLRPYGLFALWENNPWNPGTRISMRRVPFDRDAHLVWPWRARQLLRNGGFQVILTDYLFLFPRFLHALRPLEPLLCKLPLGGQYVVLSRKPGDQLCKL